MARVLLVFVIGLLLSVIVSFFNEYLGIYSLAVYAVIGLISGFLIWDLAENALFPTVGLLLIALAGYFVFLLPIRDFAYLTTTFISVLIFASSITLVAVAKYLLLLDRPIHAAYR